MAKFLAVVVVVVVFAVLCSAEPPRSNRRLRNRSRFFARQELAEAQTPYPPAGETPDVVFDLPSDESELFADQASIGAPGRTYGPPETEAVPAGSGQEDFGVNTESQRFTAAQGRRSKSAALKKSAPLRDATPLKTESSLPTLLPLVAASPVPQAAPLQVQQFVQPILLPDGRIVYSIVA